MSLDAALFGYLSANLSVGSRVYPFGKRPQEGALPALTYTLVAGPTTHYAHGGPADHAVSYQLDSWATDPDDAADLAEEVQGLLDGYRGDWSGGYRVGSTFLSVVLDDYEPDTGLYRRMRQVEVHYSQPDGS
jgi:hypothetical protein